MGRALASLSRLARDARGASILELGLALPLLMGVLVSLLDVARMYSAQITIQQAAARSLERLQVGSDRLNFDYVRDEAAAAAGVPTSQVTVTSWAECNGDTTPLPYNSICPIPSPPPSSVARYVEVTINSTYTPYYSFTPLGARNDDGKIPISARSAVRVQ